MADGGGYEGGLTALVLGGGVAGLLAARVACNHFSKVTIVDKDRLVGPRVKDESVLETAKRRSGVGQCVQPHILLFSGMQTMERLFPGILKQMTAKGALSLDCGTDFLTHDFGAAYVKATSELKALGASRRFLEQSVRDRLVQDAGHKVNIRDSTKVAGFAWDGSKSEIIGLELAGGEVLSADVVIDCSGRFSATPRSLEAAGWGAPPVQKVDAHLVYSSRYYEIPADHKEDWKAAVILGRPHGLHNAIMLPTEEHQWQLVLYGYEGEKAPTDDAGYLDFARSLPDKRLYEVLKRSKPVTPVLRYASTANVRHCYQDISTPPGLLVIGDAAQALNPCYGQGMSVASLGALALDDALGKALAGAKTSAERSGAVRGLGGSWHKTLASINEPAWLIATGEDFRYKKIDVVKVRKPPAVLCAYLDGMIRLAHTSTLAFETFYQVGHLVKPMSALFAPSLVGQVLWLMLKEAIGLAPKVAAGSFGVPLPAPY